MNMTIWWDEWDDTSLQTQDSKIQNMTFNYQNCTTIKIVLQEMQLKPHQR